MCAALILIFIGTWLSTAASDQVVPGEPELSKWLAKQPTTRSYEWKLESAELVGTNLFYLAKKETHVDFVRRTYDSGTHWGSRPTEYALLEYSIDREGKKRKPKMILPLGKYAANTRQFTLLPGATNLLARLEYTNTKPYQVAYLCWKLNPPTTNIQASQQIYEPRHSRYRSVNGFLGSGYDKALFLFSNHVVCLNVPEFTTNTAFSGSETLQGYFDSLGTNVDLFGKKIGGDLDYFTCGEEVSRPTRRETVIIDLKRVKPLDHQLWRVGAVNVLNGELLFLEARYEKEPTQGRSRNYAVVSRAREVRASLELGPGRPLCWTIGSPIIVFEMDARDRGRSVRLMVWNFQTGDRWPVSIEIPEQLCKE